MSIVAIADEPTGKALHSLQEFKQTLENYQNQQISEESFKAARLYLGIYSQRQKGLYMIRTKIAGGVLDGRTLDKLGDIADKYADGTVHVTTRQDLQFHFVKEDDLYNTLEQLNQAGIISLGAGGNTLRNITTCDHGGTLEGDVIDTSVVARALSSHFLGTEESKGLPRKVKITFCGKPSGCGGALIDDIAFVSADNPDPHGGPGFKLYIGGGQGAMPRLAKPLEDFVSADKVHAHVLAILKVFNRHGTRVNRNRARIKFLIEKIGLDGFKKLYQEELEGLGEIKPLDLDIDSLKLIKRRANSEELLLKVSTGDVTSEQLRRLKNIMAENEDVTLGTTKTGDLLLEKIGENQLSDLSEKVESIGFDVSAKPLNVAGVTSCNGAFACNEGITNSKALGKKLELFTRENDNGLNLRVSISGCPNACGVHHTADIGLQGSARKINGILVPHYQIYLGGTLEANPRFAIPVIKVPAKLIIMVFEKLYDILRDELRDGESVRDILERRGAEWFERELMSFTTLDKPESGNDLYLDWDSAQAFSLEDVGPGECGGSALDIIDGYFNQARHDLASARKAEDAKSALASAYNSVIQSAKALLVTYGIDPESDDETFREFDNKIITRGFVPDTFRILFSTLRDKNPDIENVVEEALNLSESFIEECLAAYTRINAKANVEDEGKSSITIEKMDLTGVACPFNYIKVKLVLEGVESGTQLEVLLDDGSPIRNVPQSLRNDGHKILSQEPVDNQHLILVEKG